MPPDPDAHWKPKHNPWAIALTVTLATFMEVLDTSIANVALPHIAGGLGSSQDEATWVLTSYLVSNAVILPASAYLVSFLGRKRFYMICVALFGISSMLCGLAPSLPLLIFFRVLQGTGGGGLQPSEQAILADTFPPHKRGQAFAVYGMAVVLAPAIGPTLGGWITDNYTWRWIFFINVPIAILSLVLTSRVVEDPPHIRKEVADQRKRGLNLDYTGFGLLAIGFGSLQFVLDKGQENDWFGSHLITTFFFMCGASLLILIFWEIAQIRRGNRPILDLTMFRNRTFCVSWLLMFVLGFTLFGTTVLILLYVQRSMGYTAEQAASSSLQAASSFSFSCLWSASSSAVSQPLAHRLRIRRPLRRPRCAPHHRHPGQLRLRCMDAHLQASGLALLLIPINTLSYTDVPREKKNHVSGLMNLARNIGGSCGTSFFVTLLAAPAARRTRTASPCSSMASAAIHPPARCPRALLPAWRGHCIAGPARALAQGSLYQQLVRRSTQPAYLDVVAILSLGAACMIPSSS